MGDDLRGRGDGLAEGASSFDDELQSWLSATEDRYVVDKILKESPDEKTELVYLRTSGGAAPVGPFVRKRFAKDAMRGGVYQQIFEAQVAGRPLAHQPVLYECVEGKDGLEVVMEYVRGTTLRDLARRQGAGMALAKSVMPGLCDAVSELHESLQSPVIHRDIKPSNVMVAQNRIVLLDLGIARAYSNNAARDTVRYGTPGYAPPEQFGYGQTTVRSDVYALGMTLAFCLIGEEPPTNLVESGFADPRIPPSVRPVLVRATQFDPVRRYASASEFRMDLERAFSGKASNAARPSAKGTQAQMPREAMPEQRTSFFARVRNGEALVGLGRIWNVLVVVAWVLFSVLSVVGAVRFYTDGTQLPLWYVAMQFLFVLIVPGALIAYLLLDKRRIRDKRPFGALAWYTEIPLCVGIGTLSILLVTLIKAIFFRDVQ